MAEEIKAEGVGPVLGDAGPAPSFDWDGRTWTLGHPVQRAKAELERLVRQYVCAELEEMRGVWPEPKFAAKEAELDERIYGGQCKTWGGLWLAATDGPDGNALFLLSLLRGRHPEATLDDARVMWNASPRPLRHAFAEVIPGFFGHLLRFLPGEPGAKAAAEAAWLQRLTGMLGVPAASPPTPTA